MQHKCFSWETAASALAVLLILATGTGTSRAGSPVAQTDPPQPLPENIVKAWKEAGAEFDWQRPSPAGFPRFGFLQAVLEKEGRPGDLPTFSFSDWQEGRLAKLPAPASAFGLDLRRRRLRTRG